MQQSGLTPCVLTESRVEREWKVISGIHIFCTIVKFN